MVIIRHGLPVAGGKPVVVGAGHEGKALVGNFLGLYRGGTAGNGTGFRCPAQAAQDCLLGHVQAALVIAIQRCINLVGCIAHVGSPLPFRAVHIGITHTDGNGVQALLPQLIQFLIVRMERACPVAVKLALAITKGSELHPCLGFNIELCAAAPGIIFKLLRSLGGHIGILEIGVVVAVHIAVRVNGQALARRGFQLKIRGKLDVARKHQLQGGVLRQLLAHIIPRIGKFGDFIESDGVNDCFIQRTKGQLPRHAHRRCILPGAVIKAGVHEGTDVIPGIEIEVPLGQHGHLGVIGVILSGGDPIFVAGVPLCLPGGIRNHQGVTHLHLENHASLVVVVPLLILCHRNNGAVTGAAIESHQHGDGVFSFLQVQLDFVIVAVIGRGASLQAAVQHHHFAVEPQHIFVHRRNIGRCLHGSVRRDRLAEDHIAVIAAAFCPNPVCSPIRFAVGFNGG